MSFGAFRAARLRRSVTGALIVAAALVVGGCSAETGDDETPATTTTTTAAAGPTTTTAPTTSAAPTTTTPSTAPSTEPATPPDGDGDGGGPAPQEPTGAFLSAHRLPTGDPEVTVRSICQTTPGATCVITFTRGDVTRSLPEQTVDETGHASWNWKPAEVGLDLGHWDVQVTATMNGQVRSVADAIGLEMVKEP